MARSVYDTVNSIHTIHQLTFIGWLTAMSGRRMCCFFVSLVCQGFAAIGTIYYLLIHVLHSLHDGINTDMGQHLLYTLPYNVRCSICSNWLLLLPLLLLCLL